ncbi:MAG: glycosyltransferase family 4 protein [Aeromonas sobria]|uniref:glycosyltransferase family 4 protein n=1 Tax=Aeromonas sobria TaxID=646 RepID=UPI003F2C9E23
MKNNEHVAILCFSHFSGGMELDALKLASAFDEFGIKTTLVCRKGTFIEEKAIDRNIIHFSINFKFKLSLAIILKLRRFIIEKKVSKIIFLGTSEIKSIYFSLLFLNEKPVFIVRYGTTRSSSKKDFFHKIFYSCIDYHVAISDHLLSNVSDVIPVSATGHALKIYGSTDFKYTESNRTYTPNIVHVGRIAEGKGHLDLVNATINKTVPVTFIGSGDQYIVDEISEITYSHKKDSQYNFLGFVDNVQLALLNHSIFVLPSTGEGLSNALIEALGSGLICIVYDNTVFPEFKMMGFNIHIVKNADVSALSNEISSVLANFDEECKLARKNISLARKLFSKDAEITDYLSL